MALADANLAATTQAVIPAMPLAEHPAAGILRALAWLDVRLAGATRQAHERFGAAAASDPFRGLHLGPAEIDRLLDDEPGASVFAPDDDPAALDRLPVSGALAWLARAYDLEPFELALVVIAAAPEVDLRYERLYAYLQDDVTRRRPTVALALDLLCRNATERLIRRAHLTSDAPLLHHRVLQLNADSAQDDPPLLARALRLDGQILDVLLGQSGLDRRLAGWCEVVVPPATSGAVPPLDERERAEIDAAVVRAMAHTLPLRLYLHGAAGLDQRQLAESIAARAEAPLLVADPRRLSHKATPANETIDILFREALMLGAVLFINTIEAWPADALPVFAAALAAHPGVVVLAGQTPSAALLETSARPLGIRDITLAAPAAPARRALWASHLAAAAIDADDALLVDIAERFRLPAARIADAVAIVRDHTAPDALDASGSRRLALFAAARAQSGHDLDLLARRVEPRAGWDDLVLPADALAQLHELCLRAAATTRVVGEWGFGRRLARGLGTTALLSGPSGTGKTMAAEIVAGELGIALYTIDLAGVISKYIGETEQNLERVFRAAEGANAILLFDEADALLGKRSEVRDSHDRYANIEVSYLLQRMERYEGVALLATNLRQHLDDAFVRRLAFSIAFPAPDESSRLRIWTQIFPPETPLGADLDLAFLAREFKLNGGNIKNVALAAAFLASADDTRITMAHIRHAVRREYQKLGKALSSAELTGAATNGVHP